MDLKTYIEKDYITSFTDVSMYLNLQNHTQLSSKVLPSSSDLYSCSADLRSSPQLKITKYHLVPLLHYFLNKM